MGPNQVVVVPPNQQVKQERQGDSHLMLAKGGNITENEDDSSSSSDGEEEEEPEPAGRQPGLELVHHRDVASTPPHFLECYVEDSRVPAIFLQVQRFGTVGEVVDFLCQVFKRPLLGFMYFDHKGLPAWMDRHSLLGIPFRDFFHDYREHFLALNHVPDPDDPDEPVYQRSMSCVF